MPFVSTQPQALTAAAGTLQRIGAAMNAGATPGIRRISEGGPSECFRPAVIRPHILSGCHCPLKPMTSR